MSHLMKWLVIDVTTGTEGAGVATGTTATPASVRGLVHAVYVDKHASAPATTDVTLRTKGVTGGAPSYTIWTQSNSAADTNAFPAVGPVTTANAAITDAHRPVPVCDVLEAVVAQANDSQAFRFMVLVEEMSG